MGTPVFEVIGPSAADAGSWDRRQIRPAFLLRIGRVLDLEPSHPQLVRIFQALRDDPLKIVRTHQIEEFASLARDGESFGNDRRTLGQNALQDPPAIVERQAPLVGAV